MTKGNLRKIIYGFPIVVSLAVVLYIFVVAVVRLRGESQLRFPRNDDQNRIEQLKDREWGFADDKRYQSVDKKSLQVVGIIETRLPPVLRVETHLYLIQSGERLQIAHSNGWNRRAGRKSIHDFLREGIKLPLLLYDYDVTLEGGQSMRISAMRAYGTPQGGGGFGNEYRPFKIEAEQTFPGKLDLDQEYLVYIRGDTEFQADRQMLVSEFAKMNSGKFLVATVRLVSR